jgi:hypothetical protein
MLTRGQMNEALIADPVRSRQILERIPAGRWGTPSDFEGAVVFLASRASDYVSGECLVVDGGWMGSEWARRGSVSRTTDHDAMLMQRYRISGVVRPTDYCRDSDCYGPTMGNGDGDGRWGWGLLCTRMLPLGELGRKLRCWCMHGI